MSLNFVFVFVYAPAVRTSLHKTLSAEGFLFLSHGETISSRGVLYTELT